MTLFLKNISLQIDLGGLRKYCNASDIHFNIHIFKVQKYVSSIMLNTDHPRTLLSRESRNLVL